jgi:hypothetical protein
VPRGPAPGWRKRKDPVLDSHVMASVERAGGAGKHDPATGHYAELVIRGLASREEASEWSRALHRSAHYLSRNGICDISMSAKITRDGRGYKIVFKAIDKTWARNYVLTTYGADRSKWPYDPRRRGGN